MATQEIDESFVFEWVSVEFHSTVSVPTKRRVCVCTSVQVSCLMDTDDIRNHESVVR